MSSSVAALSFVLAAVVLSGACSQSPTAPTPTATGGVVVGRVSQEPTSTPSAIIPNVPPVLGATRFVAFGDSMTCGSPSAFDSLVQITCTPVVGGGYPERLRAMLTAYSNQQQFGVTNRGLPGETASDGEHRLLSELSEFMGSTVPLSQRPHALLLLEGINDMNAGVSPARAASSVAGMVQTARLFNLTVLVATIPQTYRSVDSMGVVRENSAEQVPVFNSELRRLVSGLQNVRVVDLYAAFGTTSYGSYVGLDGLHLTPAGYDRMAQWFHAAIVDQFPVRGSLQ
jgi:lysophospholipase L1-like esterase